jgi:hypothetical protein
MAKVFRGTSVHIVSHTRGTWPLQRPARSIPAVHRFLADYRWLANDLQGRPTRIAEVVPHKAQCVGTCDAAGSGMGGVQFIPLPSGALQPILWRAPFTQSLQDMLVSYSNPSGTITNSDLELAGTIAHHAVLAQQYDIRECTIHMLCDNTPAVSWQTKGSRTTVSAGAYLLRLQALHQRFHRYVPLHTHIVGTANKMADVCSRAWHLSDSELLTYFNYTFPQPLCWKICQVPPPMLSALTSALHNTPSAPESFLAKPAQRPAIGNAGQHFAPASASATHISQAYPTQYPSCSSLHSDTAQDSLLPVAGLSALTVVGQAFSSVGGPDLLCCPVCAAARCILHLWFHAAPDHTPLATYWSTDTAAPTYLRSTNVTAALRFSVAIMGQPLGLLPGDVCARALRAGGATALLNVGSRAMENRHHAAIPPSTSSPPHATLCRGDATARTILS